MSADGNGPEAEENTVASDEDSVPPAVESGPDQLPEPVPARPSWVRRLLRNRSARATVAATLAGALLGAGTVAWQTGTLPLLGPAPCWDSLSDSTMSALFGERRTEVEEQRLQPDSRGRGLVYGQCRITSYKGDQVRRQLTIRVHKLDGLYGSDARQWPEEFLAAGMVALGEGLPGMASSSRAWLPVPQSCIGRPGEFEGPVVVDVGMGQAGLDIESEYDREDRAALAHAVVDAANGVIRDFGCSGVYPSPDLPKDVVTWQNSQPDAFCGIKGLTLPAEYRESLARIRISGDGAPARICESARDYPKASVRLTTVVEPTLADVFSQDVLKGGTSFKGPNGYGSFNVTRAVYRARCQSGYVIFMLEQKDRIGKTDFAFLRTLLPAYIEAESERIGCGTEKVTMPQP
ncbi:hypothetical protein ACIBTP_40655 [Streptomyces avidinii]|uniref:hypothetical protein n=1 Tax=Streptomyces TaxID=1883 RepID=UPI000F433B0B|nr:hypothetical protein [Streptomyces sp. ADI95-16]AYV26403.1 hypothetical protein EES41_06675 [Streptomyces sp. ADI95-16]